MVLVQAGVYPGLVAWFCGCSRTLVLRWGRATEEAADLLDGERPGRPPLFSESTRLKLIAFYCQSPLPGCCGWSVRWAAAYLTEHPELLGCAISASSVHRLLIAHSLRPHRMKYFLHITDPLFFPKMETLLRLYADPPPYLFCFDECTGIQALERIGVEIVTDEGLKREFEYKRHGTRDFYGFLHVNTGKVFGRATDNHRQETLVEVFTEHVRQQPQDTALHYICDNLAGHSTELFCRTVAQLAGVEYPTLKTAPERRAWLTSENKRIIFHFTPYHGSWLDLIEIWFGILQKKCLRGRSFSSVEELAEAMLAFCDTWNEHFAHPFRWKYTGEGLAEKVVCRVTGWMVLQHKQMKRPFLHKQLLLLTNLVTQDYGAEVPRKHWQALLDALEEGGDYLAPIIDGDEKVQQALTSLLDGLSARIETQEEPLSDTGIPAPSVSPSPMDSVNLLPSRENPPIPECVATMLSASPNAQSAPHPLPIAQTPRATGRLVQDSEVHALGRQPPGTVAISPADTVPDTSSGRPGKHVPPTKPLGWWQRLKSKASVTVERAVMKCQWTE